MTIQMPTLGRALWATALAGALGSALLATSSSTALSQQDDRGGILLVLGVEEEIKARDTSGSIQAETNLSFSLSSETRTAALKLDGVLGLRLLSDDRTDGVDTEFGNTRFALTYKLDTKSNRLRFNASRTEREIEFLDPLINLDPEDLFFDINDLTGSGTRISTRIGGSLSFGDDAPFGLVLSANRRDLKYRDTPAPDLIDSTLSPDLRDNTRSTLQAKARFDFTETMRGSLALRYSVFEEDMEEDRDTVALTAGLRIKRHNGQLGFSFERARTEDGTRLGADVSRSFILPDSSLTARVGITRSAASSDTFLTGGLNYTLERAQGSLKASLTRSVTSTQSDSETLRTLASVTGSRDLAPRLSANLGVDFAHSKETIGGDSTKLATLRAGVRYALTSDWSLDASYRHEIRKTSGASRSSANIIGVNLTRTFKIRY